MRTLRVAWVLPFKFIESRTCAILVFIEKRRNYCSKNCLTCWDAKSPNPEFEILFPSCGFGWRNFLRSLGDYKRNVQNLEIMFGLLLTARTPLSSPVGMVMHNSMQQHLPPNSVEVSRIYTHDFSDKWIWCFEV